MKRCIFFVTGTDTGVGKTVLACLLTRHLRDAGIAAAALKPLCSGGRRDARLLGAASRGALPLNEINPWHFRAALSPLIAARREGQEVTLPEVLGRVRGVAGRFQAVVVEGAGGLLSPLGEGFDSRDLLIALNAIPLVVCPNRLGALNQSLLVLAALPPRIGRRAQVVLMSASRPDPSSRSNVELLSEEIGAGRVHLLPWLRHATPASSSRIDARTRSVLETLVRAGFHKPVQRAQ